MPLSLNGRYRKGLIGVLIYDAIQALYSHLSKNLTLTVRDKIRESEILPYLAFGPIRTEPADTRTRKGASLIQTLVFYSQANGKRESIEASEAVKDALETIIESEKVHFDKNEITRIYTFQNTEQIYITEIDVEMQVEEV